MTDNSTDNAFFAPDRCIECGNAPLETRVVEFVVDHNGQQRTIADEQTHCKACGSVSYLGAQVSRHELAVSAAVRDIDGLLSADELRAIRAKYCLKQTDLERMLSTGPKTWTRWERGKVPQSKTADKLIRLLAENASLVRQMMRDANIDNDEAWAAVAQAEDDAKRAAWLSVQKEVAAGQGKNDAAAYLEHVFEQGFRAGAEFKPVGQAA